MSFKKLEIRMVVGVLLVVFGLPALAVGINDLKKASQDQEVVSGTIHEIAPSGVMVSDGLDYSVIYIFSLEGSEKAYEAPAHLNRGIAFLKPGATVSFNHRPGKSGDYQELVTELKEN